MINALAAAEAGADRLHGTALGIGERVGNCPIDLLLVNMQLLGWIDRDLHRLLEYCQTVAEATGVPMPDNYPVVGTRRVPHRHRRARRGDHQGRARGDDWLADRIYSGGPGGHVRPPAGDRDRAR